MHTHAIQAQAAQIPVGRPVRSHTPYVLSAIVALLAATSSASGFLFPAAVYRDKNWIAAFIGNDLVTLVAAVPVLVAALIYSARDSVRARLVWLGALYYMFYNYAFYVFGMPVTKLYVPLIAIFAISGLTLALMMANLDLEAISRRFSPRTPARVIAGYFLYVGLMVGNLWISQWIIFLFRGKIPEVNGDQNAYRIIAAIDLSFMVPLLFTAAVWLWKRRARGYVLGVMLSVQGLLYMTVMGAGCVVGWLAAPGTRLFSGWFVQCIIGFVTSSLALSALLLSVRAVEDRTGRAQLPEEPAS